MKRTRKRVDVQLPLPLNYDIVIPQGKTIPAPHREPYVEGECHCECPGCEGTSGNYHCYNKGRGCCLPKPF